MKPPLCVAPLPPLALPDEPADLAPFDDFEDAPAFALVDEELDPDFEFELDAGSELVLEASVFDFDFEPEEQLLPKDLLATFSFCACCFFTSSGRSGTEIVEMGTRGFEDIPEAIVGLEGPSPGPGPGDSTAFLFVGGWPSREYEEDSANTEDDIGRLGFEVTGAREEDESESRAPVNRAVKGFFG